MKNRTELIIAPFVALGRRVEVSDIRRTIDALANLPAKFETRDLAHAILPRDSDAVYVERMEALNRFMQRLRKLGLASYSQKRWQLTRNAWQELQNAASGVGMSLREGMSR